MNKALLIFSALTTAASAFAQGTLIFKNIGIQKPDGNGTYNTPIFADDFNFLPNPTVPAGTLPGGVIVGLFTANSTTPFATAFLGTTATTGAFIVTPPSQTVAVPGAPPGTTPTIIIRAVQGPDFNLSRLVDGMSWGEWAITTRPLGGDPGGGALPILPPTLTGWGPESGAGVGLVMLVPEPSTIALGVIALGAIGLARRN